MVAVDGTTASPMDAVGPLFHSRRLATSREIETLIEDLDRLAHAELIRSLPGPDPQELLPEPVAVSAGIVIDGTARPLARRHPTEVLVGQPLYVQVRNDGSRRIAVHAWDIGVDGQLTQLTTSDPTGVTVPPGETLVLGADSAGNLVGMPLTWPDTVPEQLPRIESLLILAASAHVDLSAVAGLEPSHPTRSLRQADPTPIVRYIMTRIDMLLHPATTTPGTSVPSADIDGPRSEIRRSHLPEAGEPLP
jgi:hypothetical protein